MFLINHIKEKEAKKERDCAPTETSTMKNKRWIVERTNS